MSHHTATNRPLHRLKFQISNFGLPPAVALAALLLAPVFFLAPPAALASGLTWTPETGWKVEGGILTGVTGPDGRAALADMNEARAHEEKGEIGKAINAYGRVGKKYSNSIYAPEAVFRAATLRFEQRKFTKAFENYQTAVSRYPNTTRFEQIIGEQYTIAAAYLNGARSPLFGIFPGFTNYEKAVQYFETILFNAPYSDYAPLCLMNIAAGHQRLGNTEEALYALDRVINNYSGSILTPEAYIKLADAYASIVDGPYYDQGATKDALTYYNDFLILYPGDLHAIDAEKGLKDMKRIMAESKIKIADFYFKKRGNFKAARVFYNDAITVFPDSDVALLARKRLVEVDEAIARASQIPKKKKKRFFYF